MRLFRGSLVALLLATTPLASPAQDLLSHYTFDAGPASGTDYQDGAVIPDQSPNGHDLTVVGSGLSWTPDGQVEGAIQFDGSDGFLEDADAENYLNGRTALTVVVWVKSNTTGTNNGILTSEPPDNDDQNWSLRYDADGDFGGEMNVIKGGINTEGGKQEYESASDIQTTNWQFLALVYEDGEPLRLYVNGSFSAPTYNPANASGTTTGATTLRIGQGAKQAGDLWDGRIDDLRIYGSVLSETELDQVYDTTLPVELSRFQVRAAGADALLRWATASETNNAGFRVEHRRPGADAWTRHQFVEGAGTTRQPQDYEMRVQNLLSGTHQFRLVQVDLDGTTHVHASRSVTIRPNDGVSLRVRPHPIRQQGHVSLHASPRKPVTVALYDVLGERVRVLHEGPLGAGGHLRIPVPAASLASGTYFVRVVSAEGTYTRRLVVTR